MQRFNVLGFMQGFRLRGFYLRRAWQLFFLLTGGSALQSRFFLFSFGISGGFLSRLTAHFFGLPGLHRASKCLLRLVSIVVPFFGVTLLQDPKYIIGHRLNQKRNYNGEAFISQ